MKEKNTMQQLSKECLGATSFPAGVLAWIARENLWNLWVPKAYKGLEKSFPEGLQKLKSLAKIDGSLGWTVTLCSGANYFIGNLENEVAREIFLAAETPIIFGGSGGCFGTAEKHEDGYKISGQWHYATGATYLSHFTLNAKITDGGKPLRNKDGSPKIRSFVLPEKDVQIIENWNTMGLMATVTHSFEVPEVQVDEKYSFCYNQTYLSHLIYKIPFSIFAYLTLWVNYLGMAEHFLEEASEILPAGKLQVLTSAIYHAEEHIFNFAGEIERSLAKEPTFTTAYIEEVHTKAAVSVRQLTKAIIEIHPFLGIKASRVNHPINQVFRDYFTATQHHVFTRP